MLSTRGLSGSGSAGATGPSTANLQACLHTVRAGETIGSIARQYQVQPHDILRSNRQIRDPDRLQAGMLLSIPGQQGEADPRKDR